MDYTLNFNIVATCQKYTFKNVFFMIFLQIFVVIERPLEIETRCEICLLRDVQRRNFTRFIQNTSAYPELWNSAQYRHDLGIENNTLIKEYSKNRKNYI